MAEFEHPSQPREHKQPAISAFGLCVNSSYNASRKHNPLMATSGSTCDFDPADFASALDDQNSIIKLAFVEHLAYNDPYSNVVAQDTFDSGYGETQVYAATPRTALNQSMTRPSFTTFSDSCQLAPPVAKWGTYRYESVPAVLELQSQPICVRQQYFKVAKELDQSIAMLRDGITEMLSSDIRANLLDLSGIKFVVPAPGGVPESGISGAEWSVSTNFNGTFPGDRMTMQYAKWLRDYIFYRFRPTGFGRGADMHAIYITSYELNDALRTDAPLNNTLVASTNGGIEKGINGLWSYAFIDTNFRGLKLAIDPTPLRFNGLNAQGNPVLIEPYLQVAAGNSGLTWQIADAWTDAAYEVSFMIFSNKAFTRLTPSAYSGEGDAKWPSMSSMYGGELQWFNQKESCNRWQDFGWFQARVIRAIQPIAPHFVTAIISKRCRGSFTDATDTCADISDLTV